VAIFKSFDKAGNYTLGLKEQLIFPEIDYEELIKFKVSQST
jgi:large subunit ribosomal protein L5